MNGFNSSLASSTPTGIPQFFRPLLFLLHINDLHHGIKYCKAHHFADDKNLS